MGIITPVWYFAPQRREIAEIGWETVAKFYGVLGDEPITGLDDPAKATTLLQLAGEFSSPSIKNRLWQAAEEHIAPTWDKATGEFTLGLKLNEAHPRGQWNARIMAGWVCEKGDWAKIFNQPNLTKFNEPTIEGVDFPNFALSEAYWNKNQMHLAVQAKNSKLFGAETTIKLTNIRSKNNWVALDQNNKKTPLTPSGNGAICIVRADNSRTTIFQH